ncbi:MAG: 2-oxoacid:acceptor oxidoreductase family protein [Bdellovibrionaceae bacterium]|nr:2-oxoacid:acceptor oxidoreductase family protein [Pseudobdellovibrionaceae bacterium]
MSVSFFDFQIIIASPNGSGSLTANRLLHKALFREGFHVVGKNIFPSNIEGLPTYYILRLSESYNGLKSQNDLYLGLNPQTFNKDLTDFTTSESLIFFNQDQKSLAEDRPKQFSASFRALGKDIEAPIKIKKRISNLYYVGWTAALLGLKPETFKTLLQETFKSSSVVDLNFQAFEKGYELFIQEHASEFTELSAHISTLKKEPPTDQILIEGNQAAALGWVDAGCTVATWYPITPSSSLVESFENYVEHLRPKSSKGKNHYAVIQAEDEISAVCAVVGANWAGARAATATSGPGLSLMNEAIGLAYFAEIPTVVWDIQRVGPSTGLPTRTSQGDVLSAYYSSHGDTFHPILLPSTINECYNMAFTAFDVSEYYQTPVFVLSDLDLGMNTWVGPTLKQPSSPLNRGKVLSEIDLESLPDFQRYLGDEEGVPSRTLPGTHHKLAPYMTRGSGHNTDASYSENPDVYEDKLERLKKKVLNARARLPQPRIANANNSLGLMYYGTTTQIFPEIFNLLSGYKFDLCEVKSLPLHDEVLEFAASHEQIIVIEQNRDLQLMQILKSQLESPKCQVMGVSTFNGWPIQAETVAHKIKALLNVPAPQHSEPEVTP